MAKANSGSKKRVIAVVTGSRAEYGILYPLIRAIREDRTLELRLLVTGAHLLKRFGHTVDDIAADGFPIAAKIRGIRGGDCAYDVTVGMGNIIRAFAKVYKRISPDIIVVLGDRYEIFAAAAAAVPFVIPIAHIHGGEVTRGSFDEQFRHAITKLSHIHFVSAKEYRKRVIQMGEEPWRVQRVGALGIDNIKTSRLLGREELKSSLGIRNENPIGVVTYHPETLKPGAIQTRQLNGLLRALERFRNVNWVVTLPGDDPGHRVIIKNICFFAGRNPKNVFLFTSLGRLRYLSLLKHAAVMAGNSSSGIIEAPAFNLPVVNIGSRQAGRVRGKNVIDVGRPSRASITKALERALRPRFKKILSNYPNPYGSGKASDEIVNTLKTIPLGKRMVEKIFKAVS